MFVTAIATAGEFTRPIHFISRNYRSTTIQPYAATLFFVNSDGWALTCGHVAGLFDTSNRLAQRLSAFDADRAAQAGKVKDKQLLKQLEAKYGFSNDKPVEVLMLPIGCVEGPLNLQMPCHATLDIALVHFTGYTKLLCSTFPVFATDGASLQPGKSLCRLGYPFPEFTNFEFDPATQRMRWTNTGKQASPRFPIDGMLTRHLGDTTGAIVGFEMSTPGLMGQSGGPVFDASGKVWGMQYATKHLDLNFDVDQEVARNGEKRRVKSHPFLHVGQCVYVEALKAFMHQHSVAFNEA